MSLGSFASAGVDSRRQRAVPLPRANANMKTFTPDSSIASDVIPSANYGDRNKGRLPDMILLHYTGMPDVEGAIARLCTAGTDVSAHYIVLEDGRIVQCVPEAKRAWHAGVASWAGEEDINSCSIGVEIVNRGHDWGYPEFPLRQIAAVIALCRGIMLRRNVPTHRVLAHSDVAPVPQEGPRREISMAFAGQFRRRPLGTTGADRARRDPQIRHHRRQRQRSATGAGQIWLRHRRSMENTTRRPWKWSPLSSAISVPPASTASPTIRR